MTVLAALCVRATLHARFRTSKTRGNRVLLYGSFGFSGLAFVIHAVLLYGLEEANHRMSLDWMTLMAACNITGAAVYGMRVSTP